MAHMLDFTKGRAAMAYAGATPWHGFGTTMDASQLGDINAWIKASGLDYEILSAEVQYATAMHGVMVDEANRVHYRSDTGARVGITSDGFKVVQPREVAEFFRDLCSDMGYQLETMGALKGGSTYWALARTGHVAGEGSTLKETRGYVLISTACDGSMATTVTFTAVRVVCWNTLSMALGATQGKASRTRHSTTFDADAVKKQLGLVDADDAWNRFRKQMTALAGTPMQDHEASEFFVSLLRPTPKQTATVAASRNAQSFADLMAGNANITTADAVAIATDTKPERAIRGLADLERCYVSAPGAVPGSAYGVLQAVTRYVDHERGSDGAKRLQSAWFGQGDALKSTALTRLLDKAGYIEA